MRKAKEPIRRIRVPFGDVIMESDNFEKHEKEERNAISNLASRHEKEMKKTNLF